MSYSTQARKGTFTGIAIVIAAAVLIGVIAAFQNNYFHQVLAEELAEKAEAEMSMKAIVTKDILSEMEKTLVGHIWDMKRDIQHPDSMYNIARWIVKTHPAILGCGFAFRPHYYPSKGRLFEPYAQRVGDKIITRQLADSTHDYTKIGSYPAALKAHQVEGSKIGYRRGRWLEPYYDEVTMKNTLSYTLPIWDRDSCFVGIFGMDISLELLGDTLNVHHMYPSSYDLLLSEKGNLVAGPSEKVSEAEMMHVVRAINDSTTVKTKTRRGYSDVIEMEDLDGRDQVIFVAPFRGTPHWQIVVVCYADEMFADLYMIRIKTLAFSLIGLLLLGILLYFTLRNIFKLQQANVEQERINSELKIASNIQQEMLPNTAADGIHRDDLDIACSLVPAKEVGGDLYDYFIRDEKLFFCVGDVSGKGVPSAIVMAVIHSLFRMASARENNPARIMQTLNESACQNNRSNMFVTLFLGVLDLPTGLLRYCNAGHDAPIIVGEEPLEVTPHLPIGVFSDFSYHTQQIHLTAGQVLFLYTDGLTEARNRQNKLYGMERVQEMTNQCVGYTPQQLLDKMTASVNDYMKEVGPSDDLTMMAICYKAVEHQQLLSESLTLQNDVRQVETLNDFMRTTLGRIGLEESLIKKIRLAVEEAVVNVIDYAYPVNTQGNITIQVTAEEEILRFVITDNGVAFDPTATKQADTTLSAMDRPIGGLGLLLVRQLMDSINYERTEGKNILTLKKKYKTK